MRRSLLIVSGMMRVSLYPRAAHTKASPMPVLPLVGSRMIVSGLIFPAFSAASIMATPMRSLTLWAGLENSSLAATSATAPSVRRRSRTRGVLPTSWVISSAIRIDVSPLEPIGLVYHVAERLAGQETPAVVEQDLEAPVVQMRAVAGGVRRDEDAGHGPQRVVGGQGLLLEDVEPGARDLAGSERFDEVVEPGRSAAPDVDEERGALHPPEARPVHEALGDRRVRHGEDHEVRERQERVERVGPVELQHT